MFGAVSASLIHELAVRDGVYYQLELDLDCPPYYFIDPKYLCDVFSGLKYYSAKQDRYGSISHSYHPAFDTMRRHLENNGYIETQQWHNGDRVLRPFFLNNFLMCAGDRFLCPSAMALNTDLTENYNGGEILPGLKNYRDSEDDYYF